MEETAVIKTRRKRREANPLLVKELRGRMRGARAFVVLTIYLLILGCFASLIYYGYAATVGQYGDVSAMYHAGQAIFYSIVVVEIFMVAFVTPAFTAGAINGEREHRTYELLRTTLLPARRLVAGKFASAMVYISLLILAAVPLEGLAFMLGGVVALELAMALAILLATAVFSASVGLFFSASIRTTLVSTLLSYVTALLQVVGVPILILVFVSLLTVPVSLLSVPFVVQVVLIYLAYLIVSLTPVTAAVTTEILLRDMDMPFYYWIDVAAGRRVFILSPWITYVLISVAVSVVLLLVTVALVRRQEKQ